MGKVVRLENDAERGSLAFQVPGRMKLKRGESLSVSGVCLTVREMKKNVVVCDVMPETFRLTTLGELRAGEIVNLERPLTPQSLLGGHLVSGHVDCKGKIVSLKSKGNSQLCRIKIPKNLRKYFIRKGSVAVDGVSLTIAQIYPDGFSLALIPLTRKITTLGRKKSGANVNIEVDLIAKYVEKFLKR